MDSTTPELLRDFKLPDKGRVALEDFLYKNFDALKRRDRAAQVELQDILEHELPKDSQQALKAMFSGQSEQAVLIHNFPERQGLEKWAQEPKPEDTYGYFIDNAIYALNKAEPKYGEIVARQRTALGRVKGDFLHRDFPQESPYAAISCSFNGESALLSLTHMEGAIKEIPPGDREKIKVDIRGPDNASADNAGPLVNLNDALAMLGDPDKHKPVIRVILPDASDPEGARLLKVFQDAISRHNVDVDLQPGDHLFFDENRLFHFPHKGDVRKVPLHDHASRIVLRMAAAPITQL